MPRKSKSAHKKDTKSSKTAESKQVKISAAKGRPMLTWVGKQPLSHVTPFPTQLVERHDALTLLGLQLREFDDVEKEIDAQEQRIQVLRDLGSQWNRDCWKDQPSLGFAVPEQGGLLFHGDNKDVLAYLLANGFRRSVNLVYIDPPFDSGADYIREVKLRGKIKISGIKGEAYSLGEQTQYTDIWANDNYLQFIYERLLLLKELLADNGNIVLHADSTRGYQLRCLLDEVFGKENFRNEITWRYVKYQMGNIRQFVDNTDRLYWYSKGLSWTYNLQMQTLDKPKMLLAKGWDKENGVIVNLRNEDGKTYKIQISKEKVDDFWDLPYDASVNVMDADGMSHLSISHIHIDNSWLLPFIAAPSYERTGYPTQKPEIVLDRIIKALSNPGDLIFDCFLGSGTTASVAQRLGCRWIGCDINKGAIQTTAKRLRTIIEGHR